MFSLRRKEKRRKELLSERREGRKEVVRVVFKSRSESNDSRSLSSWPCSHRTHWLNGKHLFFPTLFCFLSSAFSSAFSRFLWMENETSLPVLLLPESPPFHKPCLPGNTQISSFKSLSFFFLSFLLDRTRKYIHMVSESGKRGMKESMKAKKERKYESKEGKKKTQHMSKKRDPFTRN